MKITHTHLDSFCPTRLAIAIIVVALFFNGCSYIEEIDIVTSSQEIVPTGITQHSPSDTTSQAIPTSPSEIVETQENTNTPRSDPPNQVATQTISPTPDKGIVWSAGFEVGNLEEIKEVGNFINQGSGRYNLVTPHAHSGKFAAALTIDTTAPSSTGSHAAYLFHYRSYLLPEDAYYYSAWYYIPPNVKTDIYWNIMQWKSTRDGNQSEPMYVINAGDLGDEGKLWLYLAYLPNKPDVREFYYQKLIEVPSEQWFHIEAYYKRAQDETGQVIIWQDGVEIFNVSNTATVLSDNTIHWSVNNYTNGIEPAPLTIFIDDMVISKKRLGPNP